MQNVAENLVQSSRNPSVLPLYDNGSIWQHMSECAASVALPSAHAAGRGAARNSCVLCRVAGFHSVRHGDFMGAAALPGVAQVRSAPGARGGGDWAPSSSPTEIVARLSFWACVLLGLIIGVSAFDTSYATGTPLPISLLPYFTHAVGAALLLVAGILIARFLARSVLISAVNAQLQYARFLSLGVKWLVLVLTAAMVLDHLEVGGNIVELAFGILFGGIVLTLALAVGLGSRDLVSRSLESHREQSDASMHVPQSRLNLGQDDPSFLIHSGRPGRQSLQRCPAAARLHPLPCGNGPRCKQDAAGAERGIPAPTLPRLQITPMVPRSMRSHFPHRRRLRASCPGFHRSGMECFAASESRRDTMRASPRGPAAKLLPI